MSKVKIKKKAKSVEESKDSGAKNVSTSKKQSTEKETKKPSGKLVSTEAMTSTQNEEYEETNIHFQIGRTAMSKIVDLVTLALPSKDYGDATSGVLMEVKENGHMLSTCVNSGEMFIKVDTKLQEKGVDGVVVPAGAIIRSIVGGLKKMKNPIEFKMEEGVLHCSCGKDYNGTLAYHDSVMFYMPPSMEEIEKLPTMSIPVKLIRRAIDEVSFSCSNDKALPDLMGVFFDQTKDGMKIVSSDSNRISVIQYEAKIAKPQSVLISVPHLNTLKKIINELGIEDNDAINLYIDVKDKNMVYLKFDSTLVGFQTLGDKYYEEYKNFLVKKDECHVVFTVNTEELGNRLDLAVSHNSSDIEKIKLLSSKGKIILKSAFDSETTNVNAFEIPVNSTKEKGDDINVSIIPKMLNDVLSRIKSKNVHVCLIDSHSGPAVIFPETTDPTGSYIHIFSLD